MVRPTNEGAASPLPAVASVTGTVDGENIDWDSTPLGTFVSDQWKAPVRVATTADVTIATALNAGDTIDGVTLAAGDRVLVKSQADASENGIYVVGTTPVRSPDMNTDSDVMGALVYVIAGTANGGSVWRNTNTTKPVLETDDITFSQWTGGALALDDLSDVTITSPTIPETIRYNGSVWTNDARIWRPLMDGAGAVITDSGSGEAVMALST